MLIGQTLLGETEGGTVYYGPWFPREADKAVCVLEVIRRSSSSCNITVTVRHKNSEDADSAATTADTFTTVTAVGTTTKEVTGLKELVRFKYTIAGEQNLEWAHIRMNPPIWRPN